MLYNKKRKYAIIDTSFIVYQGSYAHRSPCICAVINRDGKVVANEECEMCYGTGMAYLCNKAGTKTGGIYQLLNTINVVMENGYKPILVFDPPKHNLDRTDLHDEYKGNRKPCPEWIQFQMDWIENNFQFIENIECYTSDNHESDDVMGTLAVEFSNNGYEVLIVSDDKDMFPLLDYPNVSIFRQKNKFTKKHFYDKFGFYPNRFTDYLAIVGDTADNYNLIKGLGDKAAREIIQKYSSIKDLLDDNGEKLQTRYKNVLSGLIKDLTMPKLKDEFEKSLKLAHLNLKVDYIKLCSEHNLEFIVSSFKEFELNTALLNIHKLFNLKGVD